MVLKPFVLRLSIEKLDGCFGMMFGRIRGKVFRSETIRDSRVRKGIRIKKDCSRKGARLFTTSPKKK